MKRALLTSLLTGSTAVLLWAAEQPAPAPAQAPKDAAKEPAKQAEVSKDAVKEPAKQTEAPKGTPKIKFDNTIYDFGKTSQVDHVTGIFIFHNEGDGVLKVEKPQPSCGCTVAGVKPDVLQPGEKGELTFTLNLGKARAT